VNQKPEKLPAESVPVILLFILLSASGSPAADRTWVFFTEKPELSVLGKGMDLAAELNITQRAMDRRKKSLVSDALIDRADLPVPVKYIEAVESAGAEIICQSKWLNAVSIRADSTALNRIKTLPFVRAVRPVFSPYQSPVNDHPLTKSFQPVNTHSLDYGSGYTQLEQIRVPEVHDLGLDGSGVLIGLIDSGFDTRNHRIFSRTRISDVYDFYWNDKNTANQEGDISSQHNHGTQVLSVIGGFQEGVLIGAAYGATYVLAKTEWIPSETRMEEDLWVMALEWMEALGVDLVSSSLGYGYFDDGFRYAFEDLNGDVCVTTVAADLAARKGVLVVTSAGNEALNSWKTILSPADGDSVLAVGAVDWDGQLAPFSSGGPTADGRIKPDVLAMGVGVYCARPDEDGTIHYVSASGTSFACPLAAGVCALVLQAHPELAPMDIREAVRQTASQSLRPENGTGWGLIDAYQAIFHDGPFLRGFHKITHSTDRNTVLFFRIVADRPVNETTVQFHYKNDDSPFVTIDAESAGSNEFEVLIDAAETIADFEFYVSLKDSSGSFFQIPGRAPDVLYNFSEKSPFHVQWIQDPENYLLMQNWPNPFNTSTQISFQVPESGRVQLSLSNLAGQRIGILLDDRLNAGEYRLTWDGTNQQGMPLPSGLYVITLRTPHHLISRKAVLVR
jgi:serine protease AprX